MAINVTGLLYYHQRDTYPLIRATLLRDGGPIDLSAAVNVKMQVWNYGDQEQTPKEVLDAVITDAQGGKVEVAPSDTVFLEAGRLLAVFTIDWDGAGSFETLPDPGYFGVIVSPKGV